MFFKSTNQKNVIPKSIMLINQLCFSVCKDFYLVCIYLVYCKDALKLKVNTLFAKFHF